MTVGTIILKGPVPSTGVLPLVQAIGIGRQTNVVELHDGTNRLGQLSLRSGKVLSVDFRDVSGVEALESFVAHREGTFLVRSIHGAPVVEPIGDLRTLLSMLGGDQDRIALLRNLPAGAPSVKGTGVQVSSPIVPEVSPAPGPRLAPAAPPAPAPEPPAAAQPAPVAPPAPAPRMPPKLESVPPPKPVEPAAPKKRESGSPSLVDTADAPIVALASAKGGVGKTTLAMNLAVAVARRGLRVVVVDSDPNGGVSAAVNAHRRIQKGAFDVVCGAASVAEALVSTRMEGLRVLPAGGTSLSIEQLENAQTHAAAWRTLLAKVTKGADLVLLDTAGGVYGPTRVMLGCATHVVGVLQAEPLAMRASDHFERAIATVTPAPKLLGIAMNMFEPRGATSTAVLQDACDALPPGLLFDTSIPRTPIINDASLRGVVAGQGELANAPAVAWTFEQLSAELLDRLAIARPAPVLDDRPLF